MEGRQTFYYYNLDGLTETKAYYF